MPPLLLAPPIAPPSLLAPLPLRPASTARRPPASAPPTSRQSNPGHTLDPTRVGMAGVRPGNFAALDGKVLSLCNAADLACASPPGSVIRAIADVAAREVRVGPPNPVTGMRVASLAGLLAQGESFPSAIRASGLSLIDATTLLTMFLEIAMILDAADKASAAPPGASAGGPAGSGSTLPGGPVGGLAAGPVTPPEQRLGIALLAALPNLAMEGATWPYLLSALQGLRDVVARGVDAAPTNDQTNDPAAEALAWFDVALESMRAIDASENLYRQLAATGVVPACPRAPNTAKRSSTQRSPKASTGSWPPPASMPPPERIRPSSPKLNKPATSALSTSPTTSSVTQTTSPLTAAPDTSTPSIGPARSSKASSPSSSPCALCPAPPQRPAQPGSRSPEPLLLSPAPSQRCDPYRDPPLPILLRRSRGFYSSILVEFNPWIVA
ncbi:hypothetical protein [Corynebacterium aquatimens]|uniref:hypothetical protein n=1 Tax=Corynebacterium aquatimens TaxID=1190508 RepID=UPI002541B3CA|nr:hypothetical protein [Corynebacterium aquatimens]